MTNIKRFEVGDLCEVTTNDGYNWKAAKILFIDELIVLVGEASGKADRQILSLGDADVSFRKYKTPEQIAAEEREVAISEMVDRSLYGHYAFTHAQAKIACTVLYDAGYRKQ